MAELQLTGVSKAFAQTAVLSDIAMEVKHGEFAVVVGPSGSGKSTLLRIIAGLDRADAGELRIDGRLVDEEGPAERGVAMVFQSYALYPHMSVYDNMAFALRLAGAGRAEVDQAVRAAAKSLSIEHLLDRKPRALSGGQRQRVAIGRAIVRKPRLFLLDEPLSNLDAGLRVRMRYEFMKLRRDLGATTVYVTHDQTEAMTLADRIIVLDEGRIRQAGPPLELYRRPDNLFVAGFIGSPKMNFLPAKTMQDGVPQVRLSSGETVVVSRPLACPAVTIGIRPERIALSQQGPIAGEVEFVERLGNAAFAHVRTGASPDPVIVQLSPDQTVRVDEPVRLDASPEAIHVFDQNGAAILPE